MIFLLFRSIYFTATRNYNLSCLFKNREKIIAVLSTMYYINIYRYSLM